MFPIKQEDVTQTYSPIYNLPGKKFTLNSFISRTLYMTEEVAIYFSPFRSWVLFFICSKSQSCQLALIFVDFWNSANKVQGVDLVENTMDEF